MNNSKKGIIFALVITTGETDFFVTADDKTVGGEGTLEPFILPAVGNISTNGVLQTEHSKKSDEVSVVKISGITKYDILFSTFDILFAFYPTEEQAREFIHQD